jgi:hypothetical protein
MTRSTNARVAGIAYLVYIAAAFPAMVITTRVTAGATIAARVANMAQHAFDVRLAAVLTLIGCFCALILGVTLYAITRAQDRDLAMFALTCRVAEGVTGGAGLAATLALLSLLTTTGANVSDTPAIQTLAAFLFADTFFVAATFFAVGSTVFCWLLLRGRMVPTWLAWVGVVGSALAAVAMPLETLHLLSSAISQLTWAPVGIFEIVVAVWFIVKGVRDPVLFEKGEKVA